MIVLFVGIDTEGRRVASELGDQFCERVRTLLGVEEVPHSGRAKMPCSGSPPNEIGCHALNAVGCQKLLVLVGGDINVTSPRSVADLPPEAQHWISKMTTNGEWEVLPVLPTGAPVTQLLPPALQHLNVAFWTDDSASEVLPGVFQRAGLGLDYRIFISYIRKETSDLAEQLHDALTRQGFSVFVDRFSVPVGVNFQERLMQELTDRGMMILLHSDGLGSSRWVEEEIALVTKYRLGLYVLRLPGVPERSTLAPDHSRPIDPAEWIAADGKLTDSAVTTIVQEIKRVHHEAHQRQLQRLANALIATVNEPRRSGHCTLRPESNGMYILSRHTGSSPTNEVPIFMTTRPPELGDFHHACVRGNVAVRGKGAIIAPAPFIMSQRQALLLWLGGISSVRHFDEGQLRNSIDEMIAGTF